MDNRREFMLDTETLALTSRAAVWQIGMLEIKPGVDDADIWHVDPEIVKRHQHKFEIDNDTISWSMAQEGTSFKDWYNGYMRNRPPHDNHCDKVETIVEQMIERAGGFQEAQKAIWWAKNAAFDFPILEHLFKTYGKETPWHYRNKGCLYTLRIEAERKWGVERVKKFAPLYTGVSHSAGDDCYNQVQQLAYYRSIIDHAVQVPE